MDFDKSRKVKLESLTPEEAIDFLKFLDLEEQRHSYEKSYAIQMMNIMPRILDVWRSAAIRHYIDIGGIGRTRHKVKELFGL